MLSDRSPLLIAAAALIVLPFGLEALGLGVTSATEVVIFAMACMALNILVGYTGLVSFGHGAWFGLGGLHRRLDPARADARIDRAADSGGAGRGRLYRLRLSAF